MTVQTYIEEIPINSVVFRFQNPIYAKPSEHRGTAPTVHIYPHELQLQIEWFAVLFSFRDHRRQLYNFTNTIISKMLR
jgi:hypothetical protein